MVAIGDPVEEKGRLLRDGGGFLLRGDSGSAWRLVLSRVPVDHVEKHVRVFGYYAGDGLLEVEGISAAEVLSVTNGSP